MKQFSSVSDKETQSHRWIDILMSNWEHALTKKRINLICVLYTVRIQINEWFLSSSKNVMGFSRSTAQYTYAISLLLKKFYNDLQKLWLRRSYSYSKQYNYQPWVNFRFEDSWFAFLKWGCISLVFGCFFIQKTQGFWPLKFIVKNLNLEFWLFVFVLKLTQHVCNMAWTVPLSGC